MNCCGVIKWLEEWAAICRMKSTRQLTAIIEREADSYLALCPELDIASQGDTVEEVAGSLGPPGLRDFRG